MKNNDAYSPGYELKRRNENLKTQVKELTAVTIKCGHTIADLRSQLDNALKLLNTSDQLIHTLNRKAKLATEYADWDLDELVDEWHECLENGDTCAAADIKEWALYNNTIKEWDHEVKDREELFGDDKGDILY